MTEPRKTRIYLASSWRNPHQPFVVERLRAEGFEVYDFRNPKPGNTGFAWEQIDPEWEKWTPAQLREALQDPVAVEGFALDFEAMQQADACVLLLPCGRSAHLEAGYFVAQPDKRLVIMLGVDDEHPVPQVEPELMYSMADALCLTLQDAVNELRWLFVHPDDLPPPVFECCATYHYTHSAHDLGCRTQNDVTITSGENNTPEQLTKRREALGLSCAKAAELVNADGLPPLSRPWSSSLIEFCENGGAGTVNLERYSAALSRAETERAVAERLRARGASFVARCEAGIYQDRPES